jgi:hypothetical protein
MHPNVILPSRFRPTVWTFATKFPKQNFFMHSSFSLHSSYGPSQSQASIFSRPSKVAASLNHDLTRYVPYFCKNCLSSTFVYEHSYKLCRFIILYPNALRIESTYSRWKSFRPVLDTTVVAMPRILFLSVVLLGVPISVSATCFINESALFQDNSRSLSNSKKCKLHSFILGIATSVSVCMRNVGRSISLINLPCFYLIYYFLFILDTLSIRFLKVQIQPVTQEKLTYVSKCFALVFRPQRAKISR